MDRSMVKIADSPMPILRNVFNFDGQEVDERSAGRMAPTSGLSRHRVGVSPVRVRRSINDGVPTAVVTPSPPICISSRPISTAPQAISGKANGESAQFSYVSLSRFQSAVAPTSIASSTYSSGSSLSRRSRSSVGPNGLGLIPRKLDYDVKPLQQRMPWSAETKDGEAQVPSNSILTLHSLFEESQSFRQPRDDSQERRLKELENRLREIETRMANSHAMRRSMISETAIVGQNNGLPKVDSPEATHGPPPMRRTSTPNTMTKSSGVGMLSVAVPGMMTFDSGVYRVQPTPRAEIKAQRDVERLENKLKHQEELAESLRAQHFKQIEQLTRQLAANDDMTQTLRSRIRELEVENELWQNRFRLYNDVDVAKILRENERLRARQRKRSSRGEEEERNELLREKERIEEENQKLRARCNEIEQKYRASKDKYKEGIKAYRTRRRQDHIELESLKVTVELQNDELAQLRERAIEQCGISSEQPPPSINDNIPASDDPVNNEFIKYNLEKSYWIAECLSKVCARIKRNEPLDPDDVLNCGTTLGVIPGGQKAQGDNMPFEERVERLAKKMTVLHSQVVDLYGDDMAKSVSCNVQ